MFPLTRRRKDLAEVEVQLGEVGPPSLAFRGGGVSDHPDRRYASARNLAAAVGRRNRHCRRLAAARFDELPSRPEASPIT